MMVATDRQAKSLGQTDKSVFQLPSKKPKIIPIVAPKNDDGGQEISTETTKLDETSKPSDPSHLSATPSANVALHSEKHLVDENDSRNPNGPSVTATSRLDIYSPKYVPLWLKAINDSPASTIKLGSPLQSLNFTTYVSSFAGSDFIPKVSQIQPPGLSEIPISAGSLSITTYTSYWTQRLQNEFAYQHFQNQSFALYNTHLLVHNASEQLYLLHVPGLRESAPRVDLGDTVHIRPLIPYLPQDLPNLAVKWLSDGKQRGYPAPGFIGVLHRAVVWAVNRQKENIILHMDNFHPGFRCNVVFIVQEPKTESVHRAVQDVASCLESTPWLRSMLFPRNEDGVQQTTLSQATFDIPWFDEILNWEQKKAVHSVLSAKYGSIPYLISGPPGTGKTKTLVELALQYVTLTRKRHHLLICAPSDAAADTIALRLSAHLKPHELFRLNSWTRTFAEVPDGLLQFTHSENDLFSLPPFATMMTFKAVVTTCRDADILVRARLTNTALSALVDGLNRTMASETPKLPLHWTALLLDEAAQATEPDVLIPLSVIIPPSETDIPQFVAAGDQYQLGPKLLSAHGLEVSLFQRLFERDIYASHPLSRGKGSIPLTSKLLPMLRPAFTNLIRNYRSHPAILSVPSTLFYNDTLIPERKTSNEILSWPNWTSPRKWPVLFQQNDGEDFFESVLTGDGTGSGALYNLTEASLALKMSQSLLSHANTQANSTSPLHEKEIMVMSPYKAQVSHLRKTFRERKLYDVNIGPLEAFQGLESRVVIICTTRTRVGATDPTQHVTIDKARSLGVIDEPQRLNVAMTRAKEALVVIGNVHCLTCTGDRQWLRFLDFCKRNECYSAPDAFQWPDLGGPYPQGRLERALTYAAMGEAASQGQTTGNGDGQEVTSQNDSSKPTSFKLKGPRLDMDDEMWQFRELAQQGDSEHIDWVDDEIYMKSGYDIETSVHQHESGDTNEETGSVRNNQNPENLFHDGYDRNVQKEFFEGCASQ